MIGEKSTPAAVFRISPSAATRSSIFTEITRHQWLRPDEFYVEKPADQPPRAANFERISETVRRDKTGFRPLTFQQRIGCDGGPVHESADFAVIYAKFSSAPSTPSHCLPGIEGTFSDSNSCDLELRQSKSVNVSRHRYQRYIFVQPLSLLMLLFRVAKLSRANARGRRVRCP